MRLNQRMVKAWQEAQEEFEILDTREASFTPKQKGKPGPKGPRKASANRRTAIKLLKQEGVGGLEACKKLKALKVPLHSERLQTLYGKFGWDKWFDSDSGAFYKQWSADLKRPSF